jgi:hypothetical protein
MAYLSRQVDEVVLIDPKPPAPNRVIERQQQQRQRRVARARQRPPGKGRG